MKINVHAGHNPYGKSACSAVGLIKESTDIAKAIVEGIMRVAIIRDPVSDDISKSVGSDKVCPFIVKCLSDLDIRESADINSKLIEVDGCKKGNKYTITEVSGNWGYLKSGKGWISILNKYVKKV